MRRQCGTDAFNRRVGTHLEPEGERMRGLETPENSKFGEFPRFAVLRLENLKAVRQENAFSIF